MDVKKDIAATLRKYHERVSLPRDLKLSYDNNQLNISLTKEAAGYYYFDSNGQRKNKNMQEDSAAFEGWASIIKTYWKKDEAYNICLYVDNDTELPSPYKVFVDKEIKEVSGGHYGRFLYRAWKFSEEYDWFILSPEIEKVVIKYKKLIDKYDCTNHLPEDDAGVNHHAEIRAELYFHNNPDELSELSKLLGASENLIKGDVYRQLGCWLESQDGKIQFLTDRRSAIDLWNITDSRLNVIELKAVTKKNRNYKVGIISELFLYMEYCKDIFMEKRARYTTDDESKGRGYSKLLHNDIKCIHGYFLTNKYHPLVDDIVINTLNANKNKHIMQFIKLPTYDLDHVLNDTEQ